MPNPYPIEIQDESGVDRLVGEATFTDPGNQPGGGGAAFVQNADPGAVGAGALWVNTTTPYGGCFPLYVRDAGNAAWIPLALVSDSAQAFVSTAEDGGIALEAMDIAHTPRAFLLLTQNIAQLQTVSSVGTPASPGVQIGSGGANAGGSSGPLTLITGDAISGAGDAGGDITIQAGDGHAGSGTGGSITLQPGTGDTDGSLGFFGGGAPQQTITGALSTVADAPAKAVLTSIIAALVAYGLAIDGTT